MKYKQKTLSLAILLFAAHSISYAKPLSDPFIQEWDFFDGITTYRLKINPSAAPGYDYHIAYTFPSGSAETDMCKATSNISFACLTGETVTRDDNQHLVKLNDKGTVYVFYDPKYMPPTPSILGRWTYQHIYKNVTTTFTMNIARGASDTEYKVNTAARSSDGRLVCSNGIYDPYQVTANPDGTQTFTSGTGYWAYRFKLDPQQMTITTTDPRENFKVGDCIYISPEMAIPVFTKK